MDGLKFGIGIILLIVAVGMYFYIEDIKDVRTGILGTGSLTKIVDMCNSGWGDMFGITFQCMKAQFIFYSPWISGFFGILLLAMAGPYRGYRGAGGYGSHGARRRMSRRTKKKLRIAIIAGVVVIGGLFLYANYDITVGNQKIDDIIPPESIEKTFDDIAENLPVKIEERP